jgi:CII-binding regulator of phage lambda lysogenization HflD
MDSKIELESLGEAWREQLFDALTLITDEARPERIERIDKTLEEIKDRIERRMGLRDSLQKKLDRIDLIRREIERKCNTDDMQISLLLSLFNEHCSALRQRIGELRPDDDLKKKSELQYVKSGLVSRRDAAITVQSQIRTILDG